MFQSYQYIKSLGYDEASKKHSYQCKVIDDDFEEVVVSVGGGVVIEFLLIVIDIYSKRNLPVAPNLIRAMLWTRDKYGWSLDYQVYWNKKFNLRWSEVEQEIKKYLLFS